MYFLRLLGRALFNPRVDYDQWQPVGHADPLKNDPTFDYVPPTLGNVRYWSEHSDYKNRNKTSNSSEKNEILLLGVPVEHSVHLQSNHLSPPEGKAANRRSSPYYPPEVSLLYYFFCSTDSIIHSFIKIKLKLMHVYFSHRVC